MQNIPVTSEIYAKIKSAILNFQMMPGQIIIVQQLAQEYQVSRTPVREAVVRLQSEGFIEDASGGKFRVRPITWKSITDLYNLRIILETSAIRHAGDNLTSQQINKLRSFIKQMDVYYKQRDYDNYYECDSEFHAYIMSLLDNQMVDDWMGTVQSHQQRIRYLTMEVEGRMDKSVVEHGKIMRELEQKNSKKAAKYLEQHLRNTIQDLQENYQKKPSLSNMIIQ